MNHQLEVEQAYTLFFKDYPDVLTVVQVSEILGVCEKTVLTLLNKQKICSFKIGRIYRIPKIYLLYYLEIVQPENF